MSDRFNPTRAEVKRAYNAWRLKNKTTQTHWDWNPGSEFDRWLAEEIRKAKNDAWFEGFSAGWDECDNPDPFVNDKWDAKTPNPYRQGETE
jgi:hypothetical protein